MDASLSYPQPVWIFARESAGPNLTGRNGRTAGRGHRSGCIERSEESDEKLHRVEYELHSSRIDPRILVARSRRDREEISDRILCPDPMCTDEFETNVLRK